MLVIFDSHDFPSLLLRADLAINNPFIFENFIQGRTLVGVNFQHPADDVSAFPRQQPQKPPWPLDHSWLLLFVPILRGGWLSRLCPVFLWLICWMPGG